MIFLAARAEVYGALAVTVPVRRPATMILAAMLVMVAIWWGAATSKLNRHFPFVVAAMESNSPIWTVEVASSSGSIATSPRTCALTALRDAGPRGTVVEFTVPLLLLLGDGGP